MSGVHGSAGRDGPNISTEQHAYLRLHSVDVFVRNQERSLRFYQEQLGCELAFDAHLQSGQR